MEDTQCLLIAMPTLLDPFFQKTTTLLTSFNQEGAMGLVLNRPTNMKLSEVMEKAPISYASIQVFWGGPVQPERGWIVHQDVSFAKESMEIDQTLFVSSSIQVLDKLIEKNLPFRFYLGYAGWTEGQLEEEMSQSSWVTAPILPSLVFDPHPEALWEKSLASIGVDPNRLTPSSSSTLQ